MVFGVVLLPCSIRWQCFGLRAGHGTLARQYESDYFMMIVGVYATLGVFLVMASRDPAANRSLIWFTVWSSVVHAAIMAFQSLQMPEHMGHLYGDVPALLLVAIVLGVLMRTVKQ